MSPQPGEVWLADLGLAAKTRPVVIVSRQDSNAPRALVLYVPLTTQNKLSPYEVSLPRFPFLDRDSVANVQGRGVHTDCAAGTQIRQTAKGSHDKAEGRIGVCA
jgi:mRNA interferase MazF